MLSPALIALTPSAPAPSMPTPPAEADAAPAESFADRLQQARRQRPDAKAGTPKTAQDKPAADAPQAGKPDKTAAEGADAAESKSHDKQAAEATPAADLNQWLPGWNPALPRTPQADAGEQDPRDAAAPPADAADAAQRRGRALPVSAAGEPAVAGGPLPAAADGAQPAPFGAALATASQERSANAEHEAAQPAAAAAATEAPSLPLQAAQPAAGMAPAHGASSVAAPAAAPFEARLSAALGTPDFAPALGVQISILVREGVQQARLHLNPAEMGPIAVQIALDGQNAQVHFQAEVPATREALQNSLPELAAALQDGGFTLSGGGVSDSRGDSSRQPGAPDAMAPHAGAARGTGPSGADTGVAGAAPARMPRRQGVVDLYA